MWSMEHGVISGAWEMWRRYVGGGAEGCERVEVSGIICRGGKGLEGECVCGRWVLGVGSG